MCNPLSKFLNKHNPKTVCHDTAPNCVRYLAYLAYIYPGLIAWLGHWYNMCDIMKTEKIKKEESKEEEVEVPLVVDIERRELPRKKYSFIVRNRVGKAILDLGILLVTKDETWMGGQWFDLSARTLSSRFPFQPGHRRWPYANTYPPCIVYVNGEQAEKIFQEVSLPKAIIWEDRRLGTCVWTLGQKYLGEIPDPV